MVNFEGKTCGICDKGTFKAFKDEIAKGVYVDAFKCEYRDIVYSMEVMKKVEAFKKAMV